MEVEAFIVQVARHVARHALAVHQEQHVPCIQSLHGDFVAEAHFLYVQSRSFLLECLLQVGVSGIHQLLAAQYLCGYGGQFDGACRTRTRHDHFVQPQCILFHIDGLLRFGCFYRSGFRHKADICQLIVPTAFPRKLQHGLSVHIRDGVHRVPQLRVVGIGHIGGYDRLFRPFLQHRQPEVPLGCRIRTDAQRQQQDEDCNLFHLSFYLIALKTRTQSVSCILVFTQLFIFNSYPVLASLLQGLSHTVRTPLRNGRYASCRWSGGKFQYARSSYCSLR